MARLGTMQSEGHCAAAVRSYGQLGHVAVVVMLGSAYCR
jgi:hypothetical protein